MKSKLKISENVENMQMSFLLQRAFCSFEKFGGYKEYRLPLVGEFLLKS